MPKSVNRSWLECEKEKEQIEMNFIDEKPDQNCVAEHGRLASKILVRKVG